MQDYICITYVLDVMNLHKKNQHVEILNRAEDYFNGRLVHHVTQIKSNRTLIIGDLHGDCKTTDKLLNGEFKADIGSIDHYIFLGDYVDRGPSSLEVLYLVFEKFLEDPTKCTLFQGNHEITEVNRMYGFEAECKEYFGKKGSEFHERWNKIFYKLPVIGFLNKVVYLVHGGIGPNVMLYAKDALEAINELTKELYIEALWSDPNDGQYSKEEMFMESFRGQGYLFGEQAFKKFLKRMHCKAMFRAHMTYGSVGYKTLFDDRLVSLFSCGDPPYNVKPYAAYVDYKQNYVTPVPL